MDNTTLLGEIRSWNLQWPERQRERERERGGGKYNKNSESSSLISPKENKMLGPQAGAGRSHRQKQKQKLAIWPKNTHILPVVVSKAK
jgi:hypothetical protein